MSGPGEPLRRLRSAPACIATAAMPTASAPTPASSFPSPTLWTANRPRRCSAPESPSTTRCASTGSIPPPASASSASAASATSPSSSRASSALKSPPSPPRQAKEEEARALGAHHFVNSLESKAMKDVAGSLDFILTTVNADQDWGAYLQALRPNGTLWFVGVPPSPVSVHAFPLISGLRTIGGSPVGSPFAPARNARCRRPPRRQSHHRALPHGQGQRGHRKSEEEQSPLPRRAGQLAAIERSSSVSNCMRVILSEIGARNRSSRTCGCFRRLADSTRSPDSLARLSFSISTPFFANIFAYALPDQNLCRLRRRIRAPARQARLRQSLPLVQRTRVRPNPNPCCHHRPCRPPNRVRSQRRCAAAPCATCSTAKTASPLQSAYVAAVPVPGTIEQ